jgi:putative sterol carrier protein
MQVQKIFQLMPSRFVRGKATKKSVYYFSIGDFRCTVTIEPDGVTVEPNKKVDNADVVLKTSPELFEKMVVDGKLPSAVDIARGKIKTNDVVGLKRLRDFFDFGADE